MSASKMDSSGNKFVVNPWTVSHVTKIFVNVQTVSARTTPSMNLSIVTASAYLFV